MHHPNRSELRKARESARLTPTQAAQLCGVHRTTYARMEQGATRVSPPVYRLLMSKTEMPGDWRGWILTDREIWSPGGRPHTPGEIESIELLYQQISALELALQRNSRPRLTQRLTAALAAWADP